MKKKIGIVFLCVILASVMALSLVACGKTEEEPQDKVMVVGGWVGYKIGDMYNQYYMDFKSVTYDTGREGIVINPYRTFHNLEENKLEHYSGKNRYGSINKSPSTEEDKYFITVDFAFYNNLDLSQKYTCTYKDGRLSLVYDETRMFIFKKSDLSIEEWQAIAFEGEKDPDGDLVIDSNGKYIYSPYFFEEWVS